MQLQSFMQRLKESEWIKGDAHQYALSGELQVEELNPAELQDFPEIIYIRSKRNFFLSAYPLAGPAEVPLPLSRYFIIISGITQPGFFRFIKLFPLYFCQK